MPRGTVRARRGDDGPMNSTTIDIDTPGGAAEAYLTRPDDGRHPGLLFYMDAIGLRPRLYEMADRMAGWGYTVLVPNVFHRNGSAAELAPAVDLREPAGREAFMQVAMPRVGGLTADQSTPDSAVWVDTLQQYAPGPIGVVGYCMGARLAVRTAGQHPDLVAACAGFHGGGLVTPDPDSPHTSVATARAEFVFGHADRDRSMPPEAVDTLGAAITAAGLTLTNDVYAGAPHGYSMSDTSMYDEAAAERSFDALRDLLARTLGPVGTV